jgi:hypothetical protein
MSPLRGSFPSQLSLLQKYRSSGAVCELGNLCFADCITPCKMIYCYKWYRKVLHVKSKITALVFQVIVFFYNIRGELVYVANLIKWIIV